MGPRSLLHWGLEVSVLSIPKHRCHADRVLGPKPSAGAEGTAVTGHLPPLAGSTATSLPSQGAQPALRAQGEGPPGAPRRGLDQLGCQGMAEGEKPYGKGP